MVEGGSGSRKPKQQGNNADPSWTAMLAKPAFCQDCEASRVVWCRVKGYPWWPAQILSKAAARQHLGGVPHKSSQDTPVIFFGTSEIAWIGAKDVTAWESGMGQSFCAKGRKNKKFVVALEQVRDFMSLSADRVAPHGWWCPPPSRGARAQIQEPPSSEEEEEEPQSPEAAAAVAVSAIAQPQPDDLQQQQEEPKQQAVIEAPQRQSSFGSGERGPPAAGGGSSFAAAAVAAAAAAALSAEEAAELEQAAATAAAVMSRSMSGQHRLSGGRPDDSLVQHNSFSGRSGATHKSACAQIWGGGGGSLTAHPSLDGGAEPQQPLGRHQRKRRATRQLYDSGSEASESDGSEKPPAANGRSSSGTRQRNNSRSRGPSAVGAAAAVAAAAAEAAAAAAGDSEHPACSFMQVKRRRLLQAEGVHAEGETAGSDSDATDLESLTMAAMAMAQLAGGARGWQQHSDTEQQHPGERGASPMDLHSITAAAAAAAAAVKADEDMQDAALASHVACKAEAGAEAVTEAGAGLQPAHTAAVSVQPARYEHCGEGLPCSHSWQYAVAMPGAAAAVAAPAAADSTAAAGGSSSASNSSGGEQPAQQAVAGAAVPAAAAAPASSYYMQLYAGFAVGGGAGGEESGEGQQGSGEEAAGEEQQELAAADGLAAVAEAAAAAAAAAGVPEEVSTHADGLAGLAALAAAGAAAVAAGRLDPAAAAAGVRAGQYPASGGMMPPDAFAEDPAAAAAAVISAAVAGGVVGAARSGEAAPTGVQHVAAVNALFAAFSAPAAAALQSGSFHHRQHQHHHQNQHHHSLPYQHNCSSAAVSDRSAGSAGQQQQQRAGASGSSFSSKRRNAAAAAALAAQHVITPPNPALDAQVANLLLRPEGPRLPLQQGLPDTGFRLPREMLLNRPPKFEWLKRNSFVSRERPKRLAKHDVHVCNCRPKRIRQPDGSELIVGCTDGCLNRLSFIHCDPRTCPCGTACTNKPFHLLKAPPLEVFLTENRGHGVRLTQPLDRGQFVVEYAGEVIDQAELQRRMDAARDSGEQHFYIMELSPGLYIDAKKKGNHARLLNSSCDPNCETQKWRDAATGEVRIGIFTTRAVTDLDELTYDYMFEHSGVGALARGFKCMCGARNCRGTMDVNPDRKRDWGRRLDVFWEGDGVYYRGTVTGYSTSSGKHTIMYDDGDVERVKLTEVSHRWLDHEHSPGVGSPAAAALAGAPGDSGSWSQTDQEGSVMDDGAAPATIGLRFGGRPPQAASPLRPASAASAGVGDDAVAAADALAMLGMAAEAELEQQQQQQQGPGPQQHVYELDMFARPAAKKQRMGGYPAEAARFEGLQQQQHMYPHGLVRPQQQWQHSSSSSQSAGGNHGVGGVLDGHSPISPLGQRGFQPFRAPGGLSMGASAVGPLSGHDWAALQAGAHHQGQQQQQQRAVAGQGPRGPMGYAGGLEPADSQGEFLPWEQLLSGIHAIKTQGPPLFQKSSVAPAQPQRPQQQQPLSHLQQRRNVSYESCGSKFGRLLDLVGQVQPGDIQPPVALQQLQQARPAQPQPQAQQQQRVPVQAQQPLLTPAGRSSSWGGSSSSSSASCQVPLFRAVNAQMSAMLLQQQQQQQALQQLVSPRGRAPAQQGQAQQMPAPPPQAAQQQQQWAQLPPVHPHHQQQHLRVMAPPPAVSAPSKAALPSPTAAAAGPAASATAVAAALQGLAGAAPINALQPAHQHAERVGSAPSFTKPQPVVVAQRQEQQQQQQQQQHQVVPDCVRAAVPDADCRVAAAAAAVQACCVSQAAAGVLGSAGSGGSTASADSALASAAAAAAGAVPAMQPAPGLTDMRHAQTVAQ